MEDNQIITRIKDGDVEAFSEIVERYQSAVFRYLYRLTGDYQTAEDLRQDTFLKAYQGIITTRINVSFKAWLFKIATNNFLQLNRRKKVLWFIPLKEEPKVEPVGYSDRQNDRVGERIYVAEILAKLPSSQRVCMMLHFIEGFKYKEIAGALGISDEAVRKRVARGSLEFKRLYNSEEVG